MIIWKSQDLAIIWFMNNTCDKMFKNGPSQYCGKQHLKYLKWYGLLITSDLLKAIFHKFYLVGSWMLYFIYKGNAVSVRSDTGVNMTMTWKVVNAKNHMSWNLQKKTKHTSGIWKKASQKIYAPARFSRYMKINWETHSNYWFLYVI